MSDFIINESNIIPVEIEAEMKKSFIEYAMSVIIDRALPDVRDGLKPVHRRILYSMLSLGFTPDKPYRKCANTVGDVLGKYHPHGDAATYESLVRMAQKFSMRYTLIDGHGNFGSRDGDPPAAQRYTESRLSRISMEMISDIKKDTVDFKPNYDEHELEPVVLPSRFPNLLVNGTTGIAVGMATNIPPHNLREVCDGVFALIDNPDITIDELMKSIKGPDFPTGANIMGKFGIREAYRTGRGRIVVRSETNIEVEGQKQSIVVSELPYMVNKARLIEKIAELVKDKRIEGISHIGDESDREHSVRIVIELKRDTNANVVLNQLFKHTQLQEAYNVNMLAVVPTPEGKFEPKMLNLKQALEYYLSHQRDVIRRRTKHDLEIAEARAHILEGLKIAVANLDEVIRIIRSSASIPDARQRLMDAFGLSEKQAEAIVNMRLGALTGLELELLEKEYQEKLALIKHYRDILANEYMVHEIIKEELGVIRDKYSDERRTKLLADENELNIEDLIQEEESVITMTVFGYIKRHPADTYKAQKRGGKGIAAMATREEDFVKNIFVCSTHHYLLFFTNLGRVYRLKAYEIPEAGRQAKGTAIVNLLMLSGGEKVTAVISIDGYTEGKYLLVATKKGVVKKTNLMEYVNIRKSGLTAVTLREGDELIDVKLTDGMQEILLSTSGGINIRFSEKEVRPLGRSSQGVKGIELSGDDEVIGMDVPDGSRNYLLAVSKNGYGKRTDISEYRKQGRGGKGILTYKITDKTGKLAGISLVNDEDDVMLINSDGTIIRMDVGEISILSRNTQGVTLMRVGEDSKIVAFARVDKDNQEESLEENTEKSSTGDEDINIEEINTEITEKEDKTDIEIKAEDDI